MPLLDTLLHPIREAKRRALLADPFPQEWENALSAVAHYALLSPDEQAVLQNDMRIFVSEKEWEVGGGTPGEAVPDLIKVVIASQACLLILGWDAARRAEMFPNVSTIIVYPTGYHVEGKRREGFLETSAITKRLGEAWSGDLPVILSWQSAYTGGDNAGDGHNVVLHEFAHKLDMQNGGANGVPLLPDSDAYDAWADVLSREFADLRHDAAQNHKSFLDHYGAESEAEFFAVATEAFFEKAVRMRNEHPDLYAAFMGFYEQDTAARMEAVEIKNE